MKKRIKESTFITSTLILILGGAITKILGMVIKIFTTRIVGTEGIGLYMLIMPTFNLFITLAQLGLPTSISKLVSEDKNNNKKLIITTICFSLIFNTLLIFLVFLLAPIFSNYLLKIIVIFRRFFISILKVYLKIMILTCLFYVSVLLFHLLEYQVLLGVIFSVNKKCFHM